MGSTSTNPGPHRYISNIVIKCMSYIWGKQRVVIPQPYSATTQGLWNECVGYILVSGLQLVI